MIDTQPLLFDLPLAPKTPLPEGFRYKAELIDAAEDGAVCFRVMLFLSALGLLAIPLALRRLERHPSPPHPPAPSNHLPRWLLPAVVVAALAGRLPRLQESDLR